jgi:hypothetical protein
MPPASSGSARHPSSSLADVSLERERDSEGGGEEAQQEGGREGGRVPEEGRKGFRERAL